MKLEEIQEAVNTYIAEDKDKRSIMVLGCDGERCMTMGYGKRGDLVRMLYQMLLTDEKEEFIDCMDEAMNLFIQEKKRKQDAKPLAFPVINTKYKS